MITKNIGKDQKPIESNLTLQQLKLINLEINHENIDNIVIKKDDFYPEFSDDEYSGMKYIERVKTISS